MKLISCMFCDRKFEDIDTFVAHLEKSHMDLIPKNMEPYQYYYQMKTGKTQGSCVMCKKPTTWNSKTNKYNRFCTNPKCKEAYREIFKKRMIGRYGKITLLNDPEQQKKMLANRKISGVYKWSDGTEIPYTGTYELSFLQFLDNVMDYDSSDIIAPSPHTHYYEYQGQKHFYIPDFFIPSLNLEIEIKDGGDNPNTHYKIQAVDKVKEELKDAVMKSNLNNYNYLKIVDKDNARFLKYLELAKKQFTENQSNKEKPIFMI